jgi:peptidyl-prolyl cis-trans isomerase C
MFRLAVIAAICGGAMACQKPADKPGTKSAKPAQLTSSSTAGAPTQSREELDAPLARVGDVVITVGEFEEQLDRQAPYVKARYTSPEQKREFLDSLIRFEILAAEAARRGLDQDPEVIRTMKSVMVQKLLRAQFDAGSRPDDVTDAEIEAYYRANQALYVKPEEVRASAIIVKDRAEAERIAAEAQGDAGRTNKGFRDMVDKYSTDTPTKLRGGDLRYFARAPEGDEHDEDRPPQPVIDAAFTLPQTGSVSGAIDAGDGTFWVLKETGHRRSMTKSLADVSPAIRTKLSRDKRLAAQDDFVAGLKAQAKIEILQDNLAKVRVDQTSQPASDPHDLAPPPSPPPSPPASAP